MVLGLRKAVRRRINRALHETRRPLQILALDPSPPREVAAIADALDQIDVAVNGTARARPDHAERERVRLAAAIENIVANALEHGEGPVEITVVPGVPGSRTSITVRNRVRRKAENPTRAVRDARRGHGVSVIEQGAAGAGGRFAVDLRGPEAVATLALGSGLSARGAG